MSKPSDSWRVRPYEVSFDVEAVLTAAFAALPEVRRTFRAVVEALRNYDVAHGTELLRTIECYVDSDRRVSVTARRLNIHRHTVVYRLVQAEQVLGCSLRRGTGRYVLELALLASRSQD